MSLVTLVTRGGGGNLTTIYVFIFYIFLCFYIVFILDARLQTVLSHNDHKKKSATINKERKKPISKHLQLRHPKTNEDFFFEIGQKKQEKQPYSRQQKKKNFFILMIESSILLVFIGRDFFFFFFFFNHFSFQIYNLTKFF